VECPFLHDTGPEGSANLEERMREKRRFRNERRKEKHRLLRGVTVEEEVVVIMPEIHKKKKKKKKKRKKNVPTPLCGIDLNHYCYYYIYETCKNGPYCLYIHQRPLWLYK